jgi:hypothetical protein
MMERIINHLLQSDKFKFSLLCFILLWVCAAHDLALADPGANVNSTEIKKKVLQLISAERQKNGLHPLLNEDSDWTNYWTLDMGHKNSMAQCTSMAPEPEAELEPELNTAPESAFTSKEPGFCEKLIQRHEAFCKKHPDLCRAALIKCKRSQ